MKWEEIAVKYSFLGNLLSIFIIIAGVLVLFRTNREAFPNFSFDIVTVRTALPGASPEEVEKLVTHPLEDEIATVDGLDKYESISTEGLSIIIIFVDPDEKNKDRVVNEIQRAVDRTEDLPVDIEDKPLVKEIRTKDTPIIEVSLLGDLPYAEMRRYAKVLADRLKDLDEVSTVSKLGYRDREMSVELDPNLLQRNHVALNEVMVALQKQNRNIPGGKVTRGGEEFILRTIGEFETPEEVGETIIRMNDLGQIIRVRDIAKVYDTFEEDQILYRTNGKPAINLIVMKRENADAIRLVDNVKQVVKEYQKEVPKEVQFQSTNDLSFYIKRRLGILTNNGISSFFLVILSLLLFMTPGIAIMTAMDFPIVFAFTLVTMNFLGITVNLISMFGLIIVVGMLVDDSIVVSENIEYHIESGKPPDLAAQIGAREVAIPIIATITTTIASFAPLALMSGIMGKFVRTIPIVVSIALLMSLFEALFILPGHVADVAKWRSKKNGGGEKKRREILAFVLNRYEPLLRKLLRWRYGMVLGITALFLISLWFAKYKLDFILFSKDDIEIFFIRVEAPVGTPLEETERRLSPIEKEVAKLPPEILDAFVTQVGIVQNDPNDPFTRRGSHFAQVVIFLTPAQGRSLRANDVIQQFREKLNAGLAKESFERIWLDRVNPGPPVGKPVAIRIRGEDYKVLQEIADKIKAELASITGVVDIRDDHDRGKKEFVFSVKPQLAAWAGLTVEDVATSIRVAFDGGVATVIKTPEEDVDVTVRFPVAYRGKPEALKKVFVRNQNADLVPLTAITQMEVGQGIAVIKHLDGKRVLSVTADVTEGVTTSAKVNQLMKDRMTPVMKGYLGYSALYSGEEEDTEKSLRDLRYALILSLFFNFLILVATFRSVGQTFFVMTSIPFSLIGVVFAFYTHGMPLGFMALMGIVGLSGVVVDNGIILVDGINKNRQAGMDTYEAVVSGSARRLRPVISTTLTTVIGLGPVSYGIGGSDPFVTPMALAMSWGLVFSTFLTLMVLPCFYLISEEVKTRFKGLWGRIGPADLLTKKSNS